MIYASSLKIQLTKAFGSDKVKQLPVQALVKNLNIDPAISGMNVVVFSNIDAAVGQANIINKGMETKHKNVTVIYLYSNDSQKDYIVCDYKKLLTKFTANTISTAVKDFYTEDVSVSGQKIVSSDELVEVAAKEPAKKKGFFNKRQTVQQFPNKQKEIEQVEIAPVEDHGIEEYAMPTAHVVEDDSNLVKPDVASILDNDQQEKVVDVASPLTTGVFNNKSVNAYCPEGTTPLEESVKNIKNYKEWEVYKNALKQDSIASNLIKTSSDYQYLTQTLEVLDKEINTIMLDPALSDAVRFDKIKEIGLKRASVKAVINSANVEKVIAIMNAIFTSASNVVDAKLASIDKATLAMNNDREKILDEGLVFQTIEARATIQFELLNIVRSIIDIYTTTEDSVKESILALDKGLPSESEFVNKTFTDSNLEIFTPVNTAELANALMHALTTNRLVASQLENKVSNCIDLLFEMFQADEAVINYQQQMISLLKTNNIDNIIIQSTLLKRVLSVYTGANNTGRSATAITRSGVQSRSHNVLLIDITGNAKFSTYGTKSVTLEDFYAKREHSHLLAVDAGRKLNVQEVLTLVEEVRTRLDYYAVVNVIVDPGDLDVFRVLGEEALKIFYITNCTTDSINAITKIVREQYFENTGQVLVTVDAPCNPLTILDSIGLSTTRSKLVTLPGLPAMKAHAIMHENPYRDETIAAIFEGAF